MRESDFISIGPTPGRSGEERFLVGGRGGHGSAYNPTKEEIEELSLREKLAKRGTQSLMPKNMLDMTAAERLEVLRKIAQAGPAASGQFKRETQPFGNVMRLGF